MNFAFIMTHSFDNDVTVLVFKTEEEAQSYLHWSYATYLKIEEENGSSLRRERCFEDWDYAIVTWEDNEFTEFRISAVSEPEIGYEKFCKLQK